MKLLKKQPQKEASSEVSLADQLKQAGSGTERKGRIAASASFVART